MNNPPQKECTDRGQASLIRQSPRAGKTAALNLAVERAEGEILVFADAKHGYDVRVMQPRCGFGFADETGDIAIG
jgi:hypothetical protein